MSATEIEKRGSEQHEKTQQKTASKGRGYLFSDRSTHSLPASVGVRGFLENSSIGHSQSRNVRQGIQICRTLSIANP